uniref:Uncharacterized protein n=1 Tax=Acrobeloides nanus TaxID=290746 RepID=A0A914DLT3_9BILA
MKLVAQPL